MPNRKVLFFVSRDWYNPATTGGDNSLWEHARYLAANGHKVTYVAAGFPGGAREENIDGIQVVRLGGVYSLWLRTFVYYWTQCRGRYDVVIVEGFGGSRIPRLAPLYVREPMITAWHQIHRDLFEAQYPRLLVGPLSLFERASAWVHRNTHVQAYTPEGKAAFPQIGFKPEKVFVVPVSIREEWLAPSNGLHARTPTLIWVGKLRRYKCPDHAIIAMATVVRTFPEARLLIVARRDDRRYEQQLINLVKHLHLQDNVEFRFDVTEIDERSAENKRRLFSTSRALILPSSIEGFGIVVLEANACGVPVIASSGVPESVVRNGINGLRYDFGKIDQLAEAVVRVLADEDLHTQLSINCRAFAKQFSWREVSQRYEAVVESVIVEQSKR